MHPGTRKMLELVIRHLKAILTALEDWLKEQPA